MADLSQPLVSPRREENKPIHSPESGRKESKAVFVSDADDIPPINSARDFYREFYVESKKLWYLAAPAVFTSVCQYSFGAITQLFAGQVSSIALAAVSIENSVIAGFSFGVMLGMGSALETLCGQAYGAGQLDMMGVYMQRSWVILLSTALILTPVYIFSAPLLKLIGQTAEISEAAGVLSIWMIPQLYAYALNFPVSKFLQAQSKMMAMSVIAAVALVLHTFFTWLLMLKLKWGLAGGAVVLNLSWWVIVVAKIVYALSGSCGRAWSGFSSKAFQNLWGFVKLSLASAVMLCLEIWYYVALILFAGYLKNANVSIDALSICVNILGWTVMISFGINAAISVRVSNELGAAHPRTARFSVVVAVISSLVVGLILAAILIITKNSYPFLFTNDSAVRHIVKNLTPLLGFCIIINNVQPVLSGVGVGAGWQAVVAYVNVGCYYAFGVPLGLLMGFLLDWGVTGTWLGMIGGTILQTSILTWMVRRTNWNTEASVAEDRITKWGGPSISS
ncbi:protein DETOXIFICATION 29-like [Cucurbita moschata]|uniref:Protein DETOXIFICATION n=1 Tax=Cucurbita moschata TaxID=3662 RepID=A0A6J1H062_CUCMO|nr:protein DETOXIFICATION 29-like [Cucurbita moschata]